MHKFKQDNLTAMSLSATGSSDPVQVDGMLYTDIQAVWTGTPVGTLYLETSSNKTTWSTYTGSQAAVSGAGDFTWHILLCGTPWIRVSYTRSSSTGSATIIATSKRDG